MCPPLHWIHLIYLAIKNSATENVTCYDIQRLVRYFILLNHFILFNYFILILNNINVLLFLDVGSPIIVKNHMLNLFV